MRTVLIFDVETTGTDMNLDRVIEVGAVLWSVEHATHIAQFSTLLAGEDNAAERVNGIPAGALRDGGTPDAVWARLDRWVERSDAIPWICSMNDIVWPRPTSSRSLAAIALGHGLAVVDVHRALTDCRLLARLFERCVELGHDVRAMLTRALRPKGRYVALVSYDGRELAKAAGFRWSSESRTWEREMASEDAERLPFPVRRIRAATA
jgi:DNA polymerase III subunit epsilon